MTMKICRCGKMFRYPKGTLCKECRERDRQMKQRRYNKKDRAYATFMEENFDTQTQINKIINDIS